MPFPENSEIREVLTVQQAYLAMADYIACYADRAGDDLITLIGGVQLRANGEPGDPAAWDDWMASVSHILGGNPPRSAGVTIYRNPIL